MKVVYFQNDAPPSKGERDQILRDTSIIRKVVEDRNDFHVSSEEILVKPFSTLVINTKVNFDIGEEKRENYIVQFSKLDHALNITAIAPIFSTSCPIKIQITNISKRHLLIPKGRPLLSIVDLASIRNYPFDVVTVKPINKFPSAHNVISVLGLVE